MKKILFLSIFSLWIYNLYAQSTTIKTPTDVTINAFVRPSLSYADSVQIEANAADWIDDHNSNAVRVDHATNSYNCHAYAWHVKDGGNKVWVSAHDAFDYDDDPENLKKYWSGSSPTYSASSATSATVGFYGSCWEYNYSKSEWENWCDHSVEVLSLGYFESKWGSWPRYRHSFSDCPYVSTNIQYYNVPISGDDIVCTSKSYSTVNITNATYNWSGSKVSISGSGYSSTATKTSDGQGYVQVDISSPYSGTTVTASKDVWVGAPDASDFTVYVEELYGDPVSGSPGGPFEVCEGDQYWICLYPFFLFDDQGITDVEFDFNFDYDVVEEGDDYIGIEINSFYGEEEGEVYVTTECGYYTLKFMEFEEGDCGGYFMMFTPNPVSGETEMYIEFSNEVPDLKSATSQPGFDYNIEWEYEVYSPSQILKSKKTKIKGKSTNIQTNDWIEGIYTVRAKYKDEILTGKLVVKK